MQQRTFIQLHEGDTVRLKRAVCDHATGRYLERGQTATVTHVSRAAYTIEGGSAERTCVIDIRLNKSASTLTSAIRR